MRELGAAVRMASFEAAWPGVGGGGSTGCTAWLRKRPSSPQTLICCAAWGPEGAPQPAFSKGGIKNERHCSSLPDRIVTKIPRVCANTGAARGARALTDG